jgi:O-antigen ligase
MLENLVTPSSNPVQSINNWRDSAAKFALFIFGIVLWHKAAGIAAGSLLILVWILCGDLRQIKSVIKEPLAVAILSLCGVLLLGILWSDWPNSGRFRWDKYFGLMIFIPYLSLLNKDRLFWAGWGLVIGYLGVLLIGLYYQFYLEVSGIPPLKMAYLHFSLMIGIGVIIASYLAVTGCNKRVQLALFLLASILLCLQFNLDGRGPLYATLLTLVFMVILLYRRQIKKMISIMVLIASLIGIFAYHSSVFQERITQAQTDIELSERGENQTSVGQRRAFLEVGLYAITQRPWFGYGTGMAKKAFDENAEAYKGGRYKDVANFHNLHYHNDLIEMGVYLGVLGIAAYILLLWGWFKTLRVRQMTILGATLVFFVFMAGLTDVFFFYGQIPSLLLVITAIAIVWQREHGNLAREADRLSKSPEHNISELR